MMLTLDQLIQADRPFSVGGKTYQLSQLPTTDYDLIQQRILSKRRDPTEVARALAVGMSEEERKELFARAYDDALRARQVTAAELDEYLVTVEGAVFFFWLSLRKQHPEITEAEAGTLLQAKGKEILDEIIQRLQQQFPEATAEQITQVAITQEQGALSEILKWISGMPEGNLSSPTRDQTGQKTNRSRGNNGFRSFVGRQIGRMKRSGK